MTYSVAGDGHLLMCHPGGPGFDGLCFEDLAGLTASRTVVSVNPAGTRGSDPWTEDAYSLERRADDVDDLRATLGEERIDYLGHSAGGFVGMHYAALYPRRVRRLVLVGTFPRFTDEVRAAVIRQAQLHSDEPWFDQAAQAHARRAGRDYADDDEFRALYMLAFRFFFARYGDVEQAFVDRMRALNSTIDRRTLESFNDHAASFDLRADLPRIRAETLVVNGELDGARSGEDELVDGIRNARLAIVEGAGHFPWVEQPRRFRDAVVPFLNA